MANYPEFSGKPYQITNIFVPDFRHVALLTGAPQTVASAGNSQGTAAALSASVSNVTGADLTKGVVLPLPTASGRAFLVINAAANALKVYPPAGGSINGAAADAANSQAANTAVWYFYAGDGAWWTF